MRSLTGSRQVDDLAVGVGGVVAEQLGRHLDSRDDFEQVDEVDGQFVDALGRVEDVVVVFDEAAEPCPPRRADRVPALDDGLE